MPSPELVFDLGSAPGSDVAERKDDYLAAAAEGSAAVETPYVYDWCVGKVRTNIEIDDANVQAIMERYGVRTKTAAVDLALRHLAGQPMTREEATAMRGARAIDAPPVDVPPRATA